MIVKRFEEQVIKNPGKTALKTEQKELTYGVLNSYANGVAKEIIGKYGEVLENKEERAVALLFEHGIDMVVGTIGALKANKVYVPFDPSYPIKRLSYMLENSRALLMVTNSKNLDLAQKLVYETNSNINIFNIDEIEYSTFSENIDRVVYENKIAYILYTSGSTGTPKGVAQTHKNILHFIKSYTNTLAIAEVDKMTLFSAFSHDAAVMDIYGALLNGATLYPLNIKEKTNIQELVGWLNKEEITIWHSVPTVYRYFINTLKGEESFTKLRFIVLGGECVIEHDVVMFKKLFKHSKLVNLYGQSESSYNSSQIISETCESKKIVLGEPVEGTEILVIDENGEEVSPLREGEIVILSDYLALEYWKDEEKTKMAFQNDPDIGRWYRTGDLGRVLEDGNIEFIGRTDFQIKLHGFRVEPGEIESQLLNYNDIKEAVVLAKEDINGENCLYAFIVADKQVTLEGLREYLCMELPEYMIPAYFVQIEKMPLTVTGKIDRKVLLELESTINSKVEYEAARNETDEKLITIWKEILGVDNIGINDSFFALGGYSLKATMLLGKIHKEFNVLVPLSQIFKAPTIKEISNYMWELAKNIYSPIEIAEEKEYYETSSAQKRMYMLQQFDLDSTGYNMPGVMLVEGKLEVERLEKSFTLLIGRHETLRTSFETIEDKIMQRVNKNVNFKLDYFEAGCIEDKDIDNIVKDFVKVFDLNKAPLLRVGLVKLEENKHILMFDMHHIISDGVSMGILINEFAKVYEGNEVEQLRMQYKDYSEWQNKLLKSDKIKNQEEYWKNRFSNEIPVLNMPADFKRPLIQSFEGENIKFKLDKELTKGLKRISKETGSTMYMVLLSGVNILLSKYSGQEDIIVGSPIAGRPHVDLEKIIGIFVNTIAMRNHPYGNSTYEDFLKEVKENAVKAYENQDYQFDELVDKLSIARDISRNPLFDVMFTMQNMDLEEIALKDLIFKGYKQENKVAKLDLTFSASEVGKEIIFELEYSTKLYKRETIERMAEHFVTIIKAISKDINIKLNEIDMLTEGEKHKLLYEFNDTYVDYPRDKTIHELFEEQAQKTPDNVAVVFEEKILTYKQLNEKTNRLARTLREKGVKPDSIIGIMTSRSLEMLVGMLAILKAGGAYLPIDPEYPKHRIKYMLEDSKTNIILTQGKFKDSVLFDGEIVDLECENTYLGSGENIENINTSSDLAYVIYTSGSTGNPKGVMIEHSNVVNILTWFVDKYSINKQKSVMNLTEYTFDPSVEQIFATLICGAKLYIPKKEEILDKKKFATYVANNKINVMNFVPAMIKELLLDNVRFDTLDTIIIGGERLEDNIKDKLMKLGYKVFNHYGPTETTIDALSAECKEGEKVTLGGPIQNAEVYILDKENNIVPIGVCGELCISGKGLARGYLNRPELTLEKFIENPFALGKRMYKTGDLARWLPDGSVEFLGRTDYQVKIRGFRIELGEIESQLLTHEAIKETIVIDREDENGNKYLCAYIVSEKELTVVELREYLSRKLPHYMIPSYFAVLDKMPLTSNGKIDRKALLETDGSIIIGTEYEAPRNEVEEKLAVIWKDVLAAERVGVNDNFFELGGHSLKATVLSSRMHKELDVEVPLKEIFKSPTISGISEYIKSTEKSIYSSIEIVEEKEYYEASSAQKRMYMLQQFELKSAGYNMPGVMLVEGRLNIERLEESFTLLIRRHETLRTSFETIEDKIVQRVNESVNFKLEHFEVGSMEDQEKAVASIVKDFVKAFDLSKAPLLRVGLIKLEEDKHILMFDMHHIISDGLSIGILINEFAKIYEGNELDELRIQYKDYSAWQNNFLKSKEMKKQEEYWMNKFSDEIPVLNIKSDYARPVVQSFEGDSIDFKLDKHLTSDLKKLARETGSTMYMTLLSGVNILLSKYSGQEDIIVGSPIAGRRHTDLEGIIGVFVNFLAMRNNPEGEKTYEEFLREVKGNALKAYQNQDYQFEELVDKLDLRRDMSRNPIFDVMFILQNTDMESISLKDILIKPYKCEIKTSKLDILIEATEVKEEILFNISYSTKLFNREKIEKMARHLVSILGAVAEDRSIKLSEIEMISKEEKHKLLYEINDTYVEYSTEKTIQELFEEQAKKTPNNIAVVFYDESITYRELNEKANRLARTLREKGVRPDSIVGIMVERSLEMIVGIIAILKAGGAYLPIDSKQPVDRISYMLKDSKASILLAQEDLLNKVRIDGEVIDIKDPNVYADNGMNLEKINTSKDLAYVIYTSGSTGNPKGVMIEHSALNNLNLGINHAIELSMYKSILCITTISFDMVIPEILLPLLNGLRIVLVKETEQIDSLKLNEVIIENNIEVLHITPSRLQLLMADRSFEKSIKVLKIVMVGAEIFPESLLKKLNSYSNIKIYNMYGPTEATVWSSVKELTMTKNINIGRPITNTQMYILDNNNNIQPTGIPGELCISGEGLARGYLNNSKLTDEKFVPNLFIEGARMYKTGDLARWLPGGNIEFLGRIDHQVKIRGFRIELGEIESQLLNHESVKEAIVLDREDENGTKYLCAYLAVEKELTVGELREYLSKNLPEYMIPSYFVELDKIPLTSNGKIDRKALPEPDGSIVTGSEYEAARNQVEEKLVPIWEDVLGIERVGINDNFFELGGHSLKATVLSSRMHKELDVEVPLKEIFKSPTIKGISGYIESTEKSVYSEIEIAEEKEYYEASSAQKRMYMLQQFDLKSTGYNMPGVMVVEGRLNIEKLEKAFNELIRRHETLRTFFETIGDKIMQRVNESVNFKLNCFEVGKVEDQEKAVDNIIKDFVKAFNLNKAPLLRVGLIKLEEDKHILMYDMHHIISDGVSTGILINEFAKIYEGNKLEQLKIQYKDYSQWQNSLLKSEVIEEQKKYWINRFKDEIQVLNMPADFQRPLMQSFEGENISFKLDKELTKDLKRISKETGSTMYMVLLSAVNILLSKYSGQEDIIVGSPIAGRPHADLEKIIGMFVNTLAMRNHLDGSRTYEDFLKEVKENALKAYENGDYQFDELVDKLSIPRDISRNPLFDVMFTMQNMDAEEIKLKDLIFKGYKQEHKVAKFDLTFSASGVGEEIILNLEYCTKLYKRETIEKMVEHFVNIIKVVTGDIKIKLSEIEMLTEDEKHKLIYEFNDTYADYPRDKTIHELFEEQVEKTPDNIAVVFQENKLTYRELNEKSNKLARTLRENGVGPDCIVGIMVERSLEMIVGIMGIVKAGGAYLPIDPEYPVDRIGYMLEDSKTRILLTQEHLIDKVEFDGEILNLHDKNIYAHNVENLENINTSKDLVYIIYTSGSTGNPKGVMVNHKALNNFGVSICNKINLSMYKNILCLTTITFDIFALETLVPLLKGVKIVIADETQQVNSLKLNEIIIENNIEVLQITPSRLQLLMLDESFKVSIKILKLVMVGGESFPKNLLKELSNYSNIKIYNMYGPTETTVWSSIKDLTGSKDINIGKPISNTQIYIIDENNGLQSIGITGEMCISGEGLARGYLNNSKLTAEKFVPNPFIEGERMYKTGDFARWLPDGNIEFLGRIDHQVKIRGYRIELGEIESRLLNYGDIKELLVIDREDENGTKYLCAYLVSEKEVTVGELRDYLSKNLPEYMIPSYFVQLAKMPLTPNGKIDRKALLKLDGSIVTGAEYEAARNEVEEKLVAIWKDVLAAKRVGINDNFFELGGHSLKATTLVSRIHKELNVEVPLREIFKSSTIKGISAYIESTEKSIYSSIEIVEEREYYEASAAQKRMYMLQQFDLDSTGYNMPGVMVVEGRLNVERLEKSFALLIRRHETLRTSFETIEDKIVQRVNESVKFELNCFEVDCIESQKKAVDNIVKDFVKAFDLNKAPLLRVGLIKLGEDKHILMFDIHHIISDGVSMGILINEFVKFYEGNKLQQLRIQYRDYSQWQNSLLKSEVIEEQKQYWINRFTGEIPVLNMPIDYVRPVMQSFEGENIGFKLDKGLTKNLKRISKETGSTMYMVLLSAVNILLSKYSGQEDIIVGSPIAGRPHADLEKIIGMFVNTLAMRNYPEGSRIYEDFLKEVKENALKAYENQDYQFDELVDKLNIPRDISRNPLFDVMFTMQNMDSEQLELKDLVFKGYKQENKVAKFDLTFSASEVGEEIIFELGYSKKLYKRKTIESLVEHFVNIIKAIVRDIKIKLSEIEILTEEEKHKLLYEFNDTYVDYKRNKVIHELFEEQAEKVPDNVAVVFEEKILTYKQLNEKANRLARTLRKKGVKPDSIVGIMTSRSLEMIVGILAILKAGGAYLPIDAEYPEDRITYMLEDSKTNIILTQSRFKENVVFNGEILNLECESIYVANGENVKNINTSRDLAYVIYTSGSTGKPKGVMIEHRNVVNVLAWFVDKYSINKKKSVMNLTEYTFDPSVEQIFATLISGAKLYIPKKEEILDKNKFATYVTSNKINVMNFVPAMIKELLLENVRFDTLDTIIIGGERLEDSVKDKLMKLGYKVFNHYGPTETTVDALSASCKEGEKVTLGRPIQNTDVYILDKGNNIVPIGVCGELCISGEGLARGYLNRPELTLERFIENPFVSGKRMYKTGDLARWLPDGNIEFFGRIDYQVKIRGFRIELGEIESQLLNHESVNEAIVLDREDENGSKYLCAYLVSEKELTVGELREYLSKKLPEYMIPSYFVQLEKMTLTPNGKIDRKALPEPDGSIVTGTEYEAPRNEVEEKLVQIWNEILGIEKIGIKDNFFELGGHSLKASMLVNLMYKEFDVKVSIKDIFLVKTIEGIANYINNLQRKRYIGIEKAENAEYYPVSSAQRRMFVINQLEGKSTTYNVPALLKIEGKLDKKRLELAFKKVVHRHEIFRTSFEITNNEPVQRVHDNLDFKINFLNVDEEDLADVAKAFVKPFDLGNLPLLRVDLAEIESENYILMIDMHHIITDGVSIEVMLQEIMSCYEGQELEEINMQYKDFAVWQNKLFHSDLILKQEKYWMDMFSGEIPVLSLQTDYSRPLIQTFQGDKFGFHMDKDFTKQLNNLAQSTETTLFMVLFSAYNIMLSKLASQEDIIVGLPAAARQHADVQKMLGMFVNTLAIRSYPKADKTFGEFLQEIKSTTLDSMENQDYQFEMLLDKLKLQKDLSRNPLFDVFFAFENVEVHNSKLNDLKELKNFKISSYAFENNISKFDFILFTNILEEGLYFEFEYNTSLFKRETIEKISQYFLNITGEIVNNPHKKLREIEMLCKDEKDKILFDFNNTSIDYNNDYTIHEQFETQVAKTPNNIAIIFEEMNFTYKEVNEKANKLARVLRKKGVVKEDVVGIMLDKSPDMIISILAILKAGAAYLPIDYSYPKDRILYMLNDSKAKVLLTKSESIKEIPFTALINLDIKDTDIVLTKPREYIKDFDKIPMPDRSLIDVSKYKGKIGMASVTDCISLQTTRGCPYQCVFCHKVWSKNHTFRSAENIYSEMEYYYKGGVNSFAILDDCFNLNIENGKRLFRMIIKNKLKLKIFFPNGLRGDILTMEYIDLMVAAGVVNINLSLETASPRLQKLVKKYLNLDKFKNVVDYIASEHPNVILELATMHGFPTETEEEAMMTLNFLKDIKWIHFPYIHILKVFPNTEMEELALAHGVDKEAIKRSVNLAYHEIPDTLPFPKSFTRRYQAEFFNDYFLSKERIKKVLPVQMKILSEDALIQKYNTYLPTEINKISDLLELAGIDDFILPEISSGYKESASCIETNYSIFDKKKEYIMPLNKNAKKLLYLDISQHFSSESMLYKVAEQPIGQLYLLTYLKERFKDDIDGRIFKSGIDFDSYGELKALVDEYKPDFIGIRTLSFYKEFFHETVSLLRQWGVNAPIITGGPYGTSEYKNILKDDNVDLVIIGEGEYTTGELIENMLKNDFKIPSGDVLKNIKGIAYRKNNSLTNENSRSIIVLDNMDEVICGEEEQNLNTIINVENLAYVMYTSGSTGKPKGIMVENKQVNNCINWMQQEFKLKEENKIVQRTNLTFDPSVWEIFWPLYKGASIKLLTTEKSKDAEYLIELMTENKDLTIMYCPASLVTGMTYLLKAKENTKLRLQLPYLVIGAEPISSEVVKDFYSYFEGKIVNTYGPTECAINNTYSYLDRDNVPSVIPIGKPVANNQIYILSKNLEVLPINVLGEIYIAGDSVTRGYIYNEEKTKEVFIDNPFGKGRLYKTGDLARILSGGNIEIMGRVDNQVKIRGYRMELQEIESALLRNKVVKECAVIVKNTKDDKKVIISCEKCGVTSNYPDTHINQDGVCEICEKLSLYENPIEAYFKTPEDLDLTLIQGKNSESKYDCLLLYSGGRASAYALYQLVNKGYKVLVATYDNGYFSKADMDRIKAIPKKLSADHVILKHENTNRILKESLKSASTVCKGCFFTSSALAGDYAMKHGIKFVIGATLSPGQIIENKLIKLIKQGIVDTVEIEKELLKVQGLTYDMNENIYNIINVDSIKDGTVYEKVEYLDFYRYFDVKNEELINYLNNRDAYWTTRKNYSVYSTNCSIKQIGDYCHLEDKGYHYYGNSISWEKRLSHISLGNVKEDLKCLVGTKALENFSRRIDYKRDKNKEIESKYLCAYVVPNGEAEISEIREELFKILPNYMVPSYFVILDEMPFTKEGKLDRKALPEPKAELKLGTEYVCTRNEVEEKLALAWSEILGVDRVGIKDNFFELGGDSIKAIQVSANLQKYELKMEIKDLFKCPTIEMLSQHVKQIKKLISQETVEGSVLLTPIQKWLFEQKFDDKHHFNQAVMIYSEDGFDEAIVRAVFNKIVEHHDALRMVYQIDGDNITQFNRGITGELIDLEAINLIGDADSKDKIEKEANRLQLSINLQDGPLVKLGLFKTDKGDHLLIIIHHLVVDGVSWRIIFEEFSIAYKQAISNNEIKLQNKTNSFKEWAEELEKYAHGKEMLKEKSYWSDLANQSIAALPKDSCSEENCRAMLDITLTEEETKQLLNEVNQAYNTEINDILLTALGLTIKEWTGENKVLIELEGHGREEIIKDINITRTVGWFTSIYPIVLDMVGQEELSYRIKATKENLRSIPSKGIGYGILKYLTEEGSDSSIILNLKPEISFNYLGQFDNDINTSVFTISNFSTGQTMSKNLQEEHTLVISGMILEQKLTMNFAYNANEYDESTMFNLINHYKKILQQVIEHCTNMEETELTPSDFENKDITIEEFDDILDFYNNI